MIDVENVYDVRMREQLSVVKLTTERGDATGARRMRLHDLDRTGWWILLGFIPLIGWIILLIWYVTKGTDGPNRFGPDPLATLAIPAAPRAA